MNLVGLALNAEISAIPAAYEPNRGGTELRPVVDANGGRIHDSLADPLPYVRRCVTNEFLSWRRRWSTRHIRVVPDAVLAEQIVDPWVDPPDPELWAQVQQLPRQQQRQQGE